VEASNAIAATGRPLVLLSLGAEAPALSGLDPGITVESPGFLADREVARRLAAADLFLAPLIDGVSTRRGSVMAALQHAVPVVGTNGPLTDPVLRESREAVSLSAVGESADFARSAVRLAGDAAARESSGAAARRLYERNFDWPVIAGRLISALPDG
jgi:glycosyltransferase involved in cell wall biosynthesis